jgi:predicted transcriptional regulator
LLEPKQITAYAQEKAEGKRRPSGALYLKKLSGKHLRMINMHLAGMTGKEIAQQMELTEPAVSKILTDPLAIEMIQKQFQLVDMELRALMGKSVEGLRTALDCDDISLKLSAADKVLRSQGYYNPKNNQQAAVTAEDLVKMLLEKTEPGEKTSVSITVEKE